MADVKSGVKLSDLFSKHAPYLRSEWDGLEWLDCSCGRAGGRLEHHLAEVLEAAGFRR